MKRVKFGHLTTSSQEMRKYNITKTGILMGTRGDPTNLRKFEGRQRLDVLEQAIGVMVRLTLSRCTLCVPHAYVSAPCPQVRSKTKAGPPKNGAGATGDSVLLSELADQTGLDACLSVKGICVIAFVRGQGSRSRRGKPQVVGFQGPTICCPASAGILCGEVA